MKNAAVKYREFWIEKSVHDNMTAFKTHVWNHPLNELPAIHVIEYSALEAERARSEKLEASLKSAVDALESTKGWVISYSIQTYSSVASREAEAIEDLLAELKSKHPDMFKEE
jgi:hypothetical protein